MNGFVTPVLEKSEADPVQIGDSLGVFRQDDDQGHIHLQTTDDDIDLGFHDISVSRLRPDGSPVQFFREDGEVFVRNMDNASEVEIRYLRSTDVLEKGEYAKIRGDCVVEPGIHTELLVTLEPDSEESDGFPPRVLVKSRCRSLEMSTQNGDHETIIDGRALLKVLKDHPLDVERYGTVVRDLEAEIENLEDTESFRDDGSLKEERRQEVERLTNEITDIYDLHA